MAPKWGESVHFWTYGGFLKDGANHFPLWPFLSHRKVVLVRVVAWVRRDSSVYAAFSKNLSGWSGRFQRRPCGELRSLRAFKVGALAETGDSGRFASFSKAPPLNSSGGSARFTWPAPKMTRPMDPSWTGFLESQPSMGFDVGVF